MTHMTVSRDVWPLLQAENRSEMLAYLGTAPSATSHRSVDLTWVVTGVPSQDYNGVIWTRLSGADADVQVPALVDQFRDQGLPALWHLDPATEPEDLGHRLAALGCRRLPGTTCLGADLNGLAREMARFPGLTVERATTVEELTEWLDVWLTGSKEPRGPREDLYASLGLGGRQVLHHYVARIDGQPAGVAQLFLGQRAAGLYSVKVAATYRGRGIGTALVLTPLLVARTLGYEVGVVQSTDESLAMYEHLGFELLRAPSTDYVIGSER